MNLPGSLFGNQMILAAIVVLARSAIGHLGVTTDMTVADLARTTGTNRTYLYEVAHRVAEALEPVALATSGRPPSPEELPEEDDPYCLRLEIQVLRYRLEHPGCITPRPGGRSSYSPDFRRFILRLHDDLPGDRNLEQFAGAVQVPLDTLRDWLDVDRRGMTPPPEPVIPLPQIPRDACRIVRVIAEAFAHWSGSTREFLRFYAAELHLAPGQIIRVLRILGLVPSRTGPAPRRPRYRGSTECLSPGSVLVTDGTNVDIFLIDLEGESSIRTVNWQGIVDQATGCHTAIVVSDEETADSAYMAFSESIRFLGGRGPLAFLHDGKPCYDEFLLQYFFNNETTKMIPASPDSPENKAIIEGCFGLFEQQVGPIALDVSSFENLLKSIAQEVLRAWTAGTDHAPREELGGKSRRQALRAARPGPEQIERDRRFLRDLEKRHNRKSRRKERPDSRALLDEIFRRWELLDRDSNGSLRRYLSWHSPEVIERAAAIFAARMNQGAIDPPFAHRYLVKLIQAKQAEIDMEIAEVELLHLARLRNEDWTAAARADLDQIPGQSVDPKEMGRQIAEIAAHAGIPIEGAFWTEALLDFVRQNPETNAPIRRHLKRLDEADFERRLALVHHLVHLQEGLR